VEAREANLVTFKQQQEAAEATLKIHWSKKEQALKEELEEKIQEVVRINERHSEEV
jgi:hypothetical protein